jgi:hypothetical protein
VSDMWPSSRLCSAVRMSLGHAPNSSALTNPTPAMGDAIPLNSPWTCACANGVQELVSRQPTSTQHAARSRVLV